MRDRRRRGRHRSLGDPWHLRGHWSDSNQSEDETANVLLHVTSGVVEPGRARLQQGDTGDDEREGLEGHTLPKARGWCR